MSIQSEVERISTNVQNTLDTIRQTGVSVPENATSDNLPAAAQALADEKQNKLTGTSGQYVGFDSSGNATAVDLDDQTASDIGYTNNDQTSVSGALDALFQGLADGTITPQVITATSSGWSGDIPTQTLNVTGINADTVCWVGLDDSANAQQRDAARKAVMSPTAQGTNSITLTCDGVKPTVDLPILIYISGGAS